jgi:hypothetical protein
VELDAVSIETDMMTLMEKDFVHGGPVPQKIGICEECGWYFPVGPHVTDGYTGLCPKEGCDAGVMVVPPAPKPTKLQLQLSAYYQPEGPPALGYKRIPIPNGWDRIDATN